MNDQWPNTERLKIEEKILSLTVINNFSKVAGAAKPYKASWCRAVQGCAILGYRNLKWSELRCTWLAEVATTF